MNELNRFELPPQGQHGPGDAYTLRFVTEEFMQSDRGRPAPSNEPDVRAEGVGKAFGDPGSDQVVALEDVDLAVGQGEVLAILGSSGCGKSTFLNLVGGLLTPTSGSISVAGDAVDGPSPSIGMMFQRPVLFPWLTVLDNIQLPMRVHGAKKNDFRDRATELVELVGLGGFGDRYPAELSGGMQQRVAICRMLIAEPHVLLLDEPFGALDELTREFMNSELRHIIVQQGRSAILVTHNPLEAVFMADRVAVFTPRPGTVAGIVDIPLGIERPKDLFTSDATHKYERDVRELFETAHGERSQEV